MSCLMCGAHDLSPCRAPTTRAHVDCPRLNELEVGPSIPAYWPCPDCALRFDTKQGVARHYVLRHNGKNFGKAITPPPPIIQEEP